MNSVHASVPDDKVLNQAVLKSVNFSDDVYHNDKLQVIDYLGMSPYFNDACPNKFVPSDHVPIIVVFKGALEFCGEHSL